MTTETRATATNVRRYRLSVDQYLAALKANIIPETARSELLGGILINKVTRSRPHHFVVIKLSQNPHRILPEPWFFGQGMPVKLGRYCYPEADISIIRRPHHQYERQAPDAADLGLLIEVADSSYPIDRGKKWRRYETARVPIYWIVNLPQRRIEVHSDPAGWGRSASYRQAMRFGEGDSVPVILDGQEVGRIDVGGILPSP